MRVTSAIRGLLLAALVAFGCDRQDEIRVYTAPKDPPEAAVPPQAQAPQPPHALPMDVHWTVPEGWRERPGDQTMRLATFEAGPEDRPLEIAVTRFPGDVGGLLANVNRWREQLGLDPITAAELDQHVTSFPLSSHVGGAVGHFVRIAASTDPEETSDPIHMAAAIIPTDDGQTLFIRAMGDASQIERHEAELRRFAHSVHFVPAEPLAGHPAPAGDQAFQGDSVAAPAPGSPSIEPPAGRAEPARQEIAWQKPEDWSERQPPAIVYAMFEIRGTEGEAMVTLTPLRGGGGALLDNVNMWRSQIGLSPIVEIDPEQSETIRVGGRDATLVAAARPGEVPPAGLGTLVAIVPDDERSWYIRLSGDAAAVEVRREQFVRFVESIEFLTEDVP